MEQVLIEPAKTTQAEELGRICYEAFKDISERHGFEPDFPSIPFTQTVIGSLISREDYYSIAAFLDGRPAGSNFLTLMDEVSGVGPITVDVPLQGRGIGRLLMEDVLAYAAKNGIEGVRLLQDAFNMTSLSLYASLGFDVREPVGLLQPAPSPEPDGTIRPASQDDLQAVEGLCRDIYKLSRRNEVVAAPRLGMTALVREKRGRLSGYLVPGFVGHGVAETEEDMLALFGEAARQVGPSLRVFCPLTLGSLFRKALAAGGRLKKVMNLMAYGPYEPPDGVWVPSVLY